MVRQETPDSAAVPRKMGIARWLFNPFVRVGGEQALLIGTAVIVVTGLLAAAGETHFGGLLRLSIGSSVPLWVPVVEGLVIWVVMSVLFVLISLLVAPRSVRPLDIAGTQALARAPLVLLALANLPAPVRDANRETAAAIAEGRLPPQMAASLIAGVVGGVCVVWMVQLMWKAFAVSCNQRGGRAVAFFVAVVITGHLATSFLLMEVFGGLVSSGLPGGS
ncbi:MAG: hypothetical protein OXH05_12100 [Acidobacteria bacterium]|nr:hypothetical protein [Acidobacteriota bacterium]MXW38242.1 hypothetical protein [Acidobacteriota bacterium]MYA45083.1 hypothetical protein [Acidobacteriota bacterium]MYI37822.1 hypothetical protein [Acidobacteriota bacterium]